MEEGELLFLVRSVNAMLDVYYRGSPPRDVVIEVEGETVSYGDLVDRLLNPGRSGRDLARWREAAARRESERRAQSQGSRRADGDDNPGWAGSGMHWVPSLSHLEFGMRSHP